MADKAPDATPVTVELQWLTAAPNPRAYAGGRDAGRHAWARHGIKACSSETFGAIKGRKAACGLVARHGWDDDLFIPERDEHVDYRCKRCCRSLGIRHESLIEERMRERADA